MTNFFNQTYIEKTVERSLKKIVFIKTILKQFAED